MDGRGKLKNWIIVTQPWAFPASGSAALMAISYVFYLYKTGAVAESNWLFGIIGLIGAVIFQMSANLMNEYQDFKHGVDVKEKTGPPRLLVEGVFQPKTIFRYSLCVLTVGMAIGIYLTIKTGWPLLVIGGFGIISAMLYHKFKYIALGDHLIFVTYGLSIPLGIAFVMTGELIWTILLVSIPVGLLEVAILHANNTRDIKEDKAAGTKTQAMILGLEGAQVTYQTLLLAAYLLIAILVSVDLLHPITFLTLLSFPLANRNIKKMKMAKHDDFTSIQYLDGQTAKLLLLFVFLLSAANFIAPFI
ncbi:MAG: 1,4-dihydroxy-2-naphthoate octaprenyltransferase [Fermentimonas sp.]|nr:1,4-dihydroxy-2-naphthoate octaprenyltransferase [Fermentimonas sp.]